MTEVNQLHDSMSLLKSISDGTSDAVLESEERFRILSEASFEGVAISDDGQLVDVND